MRRRNVIIAGAALAAGAAGLYARRQAVRRERPTLKVASQKGSTKALVLVSGVLRGKTYEIQWSEFPSAQTLLEALSAEAVDLGATADAPFMFAYSAGSKIKAVQASAQLGEGRAVAVLVSHSSPARTFVDLRGKRVATGKGSVGHDLLLRLLDRSKLGPNDIEFVFMDPANAKAAFSTGAVDAWSTWASYVALATLHDTARVLVDGTGVLNGLGFYGATQNAIAEKRPLLEDFLKRLVVAERWGTHHLDAFAVSLQVETGVPLDVAKFVADTSLPIPVPIDQRLFDEEKITIGNYARAGLLRPPIDLTQAFDPSFDISLKAGIPLAVDINRT